MGMKTILFNGAEPFEQIANIPSTKGRMWNLVKFGRAVPKKKTFKDFTILYMYIAKEKGRQPPKILMVTK